MSWKECCSTDMSQKLQIGLTPFQAAIFDMNGTMIDDMAYHKIAWTEFFKRHGVELTDDEFRQKVSGKKNNQIFTEVFGKDLTPNQIREYTDEKEATYREMYAPDIHEVAGLTHSIEQLQGHGLKIAIATTAPAKNREFALEKLGLVGKFEVILGDEDVSKGKPDPQIYLQTAAQLGAQPERCIVFEDSPPGVAAGKRAGMTVIGLLTSHSADELADADFTIEDFTDIEFI